MSVSIDLRPARSAAASRLDFGRISLCVLLLFPLALAMSWPRIVTVWQSGTFFDTDDAMRMVQVRDWMSGQGWFDLVQHRLDPPIGLLTHWSRVVDVPLSLLVRVFSLVADPVHAERLARLAFPLALQAGMIATTAWTARCLIGPRAVMPAALMVLVGGIAYGQFQPGRIDHHAPQILLLMLATGATLRSLDPLRGRWAALTAAAMALSIAISLENLPFFVVLLPVPALAWAFGGARYRQTLAWFAAGLAIALPALFVATIPPTRYLVPTYDAFSIAHLTGLMAGAAALGVLVAGSSWLTSAVRRWSGLACAGLVVMGLVIWLYPAALHDPYATMDPLLVTLWLRHVQEAQPLLEAIQKSPDVLTLLACPILMGVAAAMVALWRARGLDRVRWLVVAGLLTAGLLGAMWEVRVTSSVGPLALLGGIWVVTRALAFANQREKAVYALLPFGAACLFSTLAWALVPVPEDWHGTMAKSASSGLCRQPAVLEPLASLPASLAFSPIDSGSHLLAYTPLSVLAAPYHRDQHGIRIVLQGLSASPENAKAIVEASGAGLLLYCRDDTQVKMIAKIYPGSLAAALLAGHPPAWLTPVAIGDGTYPVFQIR